MTTKEEEAIRDLKKLKSFHNGSYGTAIDVAIKYLEQRPCEDCISRQDAIKEFQSYREYNSNRTNNEWVDRIEGVLKLLPPVAPQTVTEFADKCKECGSIKEDLYEKGFEDGKHYILGGTEMIIVKYPEWVEAQLKILDERIEEMYREYEGIKVRPDEAMRIKKNMYERTKPFVDEKVRLITNCNPKYMVDGAIKESEDKEWEL